MLAAAAFYQFVLFFIRPQLYVKYKSAVRTSICMTIKNFATMSNNGFGFSSDNLSGPNCDNGGYNVSPANDN